MKKKANDVYRAQKFTNIQNRELTRMTIRMPKSLHEGILAKLETMIVNKSINMWVVEQIIRGLNL